MSSDLTFITNEHGKSLTDRFTALLGDNTRFKVLAVLRRDIKQEYSQTSPAAHASPALAPREVILSSWLVQTEKS